MRVHPGSHLSLCISLHDTCAKFHTSTSRTRYEFIPVVILDRDSDNGMKSDTGITLTLHNSHSCRSRQAVEDWDFDACMVVLNIRHDGER